MKKLSLIIALALIVSIGGVYATWTYAGADASGNHKHMSVNLAVATNTASEGVITEVSNTMDVKIDDTDGNYTADLVITGKMCFVFTPSKGADDAVVDNGIDMQWKLEQTNPGIQHNGVNIFTIDQATPTALTSEKIDSSNIDAISAKCGVELNPVTYIGSFYVEITADDVDDVLSTTLRLPTYADYLTFEGEMSSSAGKLGITVSKAA